MAREQHEKALEAADYLWPLTTIRDTLLRPAAERQIPAPTLRALLDHHLPILRTPWKPFEPPSAASRKALSQPTVTLPRSSASIKVDPGARDLSTRLADLVHVDEITAFWLFKSYAAYSVEELLPHERDDQALLDRLVLWYEQELLAVPQIVMALYVPASEPTGWEELAAELKSDILGDEAAYIEGLFRAFSSLAQKQVDESGPRAVFWASVQLRQQEVYLDLLFLVLYQYTTRSASVSEGLLRGAVMSGFGTLQANRDIFESDADSVRTSVRVRDLLVVIAVESLCLAQVVSPEDNGEAFGGTLLHARDRIHSVHQFVLEQTEDLAQAQDEIAQWPIAVVALAWAVALRSLPGALLPPTTDYFQLDANEMAEDPAVHIEVASRALRLSAGLFPWLEQILAGPLLETGSEVVADMAALRRSPLKDLLIGLSDLLDIDHVADRSGLYRSWELLFGGGSLVTSTSLCNNYWAVDFPYADRRAILDRSRFPREPAHLPRVLAALTGVSSMEEVDMAAISDAVPDVFDYVNALPSIVIAAQPGTFTLRGRDGAGNIMVEATRDLVFPATVIPRGTRGTAVDDEIAAISWRFGQSAWPLIVALMRGAAQLPLAETPITLVDLGVSSTLPEILSANLRLVRCVLRSPDVAARVLAATAPVDRFAGQSLLDIALAVLASDQPDTVTYALDIVQSLLRVSADDVGNALRASGFFDPTGRRPASVGAMIQADAARGEHALTVALLRLIRSLTASGAGSVVQSALRLVLGEVWGQYGGWRYRDVAKKHEIASLLFAVFELALRRGSPVLRVAFIESASPLTYKPIVDAIIQASPLATKLIQSRRWADANLVFLSFDQAVSLLSALVRTAKTTSATSLPHSLFATTIGKTELVDTLFSLLWDPSLQTSSLRLLLRLLRVHLETTATDPQRPALSGLVRDVGDTADKLTALAFNSAYVDVKPDAWALLGSMVSTQPGCAGIVVDHALKRACCEVLAWETALGEGPASLATALGFLQAMSDVRPRKLDDDVWQAVHDIATHYVRLPSSFSDDIAHDVAVYSYAIQSKANATALLAAELARLDPDAPQTKAQTLAVSLFRNEGKLADAATAAVFNCADPEVHATEGETLTKAGVDLAAATSICLPVEREYGQLYLYEKQAVVGHALAILNLNWSQLDADVNLTKAFRVLVDAVAPLTEGDALASKAALAAAVAVAGELAKEDRGGDVMFAIQTERIGILAALLESGLEDEPDAAQVKAIAPLLRQILESQNFAPILSLRHEELPALHRPVLQILLLLAQSSVVNVPAVADILADSGADFALDAADIVLDLAARSQPSPELPLVLSLLCELSRVPGWVDKLSDVNLVGRTLDVLIRTRIVDGVVPAHVQSILILHLALASNAHSAEKLAVSGILPAYADTAVVAEAEHGRIDADGPAAAAGLHAAWTGMLVVVQALLATLPDTATYARSDVVPFVRVTMRQLQRALDWDGERALSRPALDEMARAADIVHGLALALGPAPGVAGARAADGVLDDFAPPALALLAGARYALSHPHRFTALLVPADAAEQAALEKSIEAAGDGDIDLADERTPVIRDRTVRLVGAARNVAVALVRLTRAWDVMGGDEPDAQHILGSDDSPSADPVGVLNDLVSLALPLAARLPRVSVASQLAEAAALLALTQLMARAYFLPPESDDDAAPGGGGMDVDAPAAAGGAGGGARRRSTGRASLGALVGKHERARLVVRELEGDLRGVLPDTGVFGALKKVAGRAFE